VTQNNLKFAGSNPEHYDRHLGPVLFEPYAADLAHRVGLAVHHGTVVELACGTGILTRHLREALPPTVSLVATDVSAAMVRYAESAIRVEGIGWRTADAMDLPFEAGFATAIVCQFGLMFVADKPRAVREMQRVLTADGRIWVSVWDSLGANPVAAVANAALAKAVGTSPPVPFFNIPHGLSDTDALLQLFEENGFTDVQIELVPLDAISDSAESIARGYVFGTPLTSILAERGADHAGIAVAMAEALRDEGGDRPFRSRSRAWLLTARRDTD
jgi:SAM-dependent methyltransferase